MSVRRVSVSLWRAFSTAKLFQNEAELEAWLKRKGLQEDAGQMARPLFVFGYRNSKLLQAASKDALKQAGLSLPLAELLAKALQSPPAKYTLLGGQTLTTQATTVDELLQSLPDQEYPFAVLGPSGQPMSRNSPLGNEATHPVVYEFTFPDEFKAQPLFPPPEHPIVAIEPTIAEAMQHVHANINKSTSSEFRVPPVIISSLARSGKTTTLKHLFNAIKEEGKYIPVFVTFNGQSGFVADEKATDVQEFLRGVSTQLVPNAIPAGKAVHTYFSWQSLDEYLNRAGKPVVLLVDELNALLFPPSPELALHLRTLFLDPAGRYLCFTSHRSISLAEATAGNEELGRTKEPPSPRDRRFVEVAQTRDLQTLHTIVPDLNPAEVALYAGLCALIFSIKVSRFEYFARFRSRFTPEFLRLHMGSFLLEFVTGAPCTPPEFAEFTFRDRGGESVLWPLCYAEAYLALCQGPSEELLATLIRNTMALADSGADELRVWEALVQIGVGLVALYAQYQRLTGIREEIFRLDNRQPDVRIVRLPKDIQTFDQAEAFIQEKIRRVSRTKDSILVLAIPQFEDFPDFDTIVRLVDAEGGDWAGIQTKLGKGLPQKSCSKKCRGYVFRGGATGTSSGPQVLENWENLDSEQIRNFLPFSMRRLYPGGLPQQRQQGEVD